MNQLYVSLQHTIATLAANGWSARKIARQLGIHRETVGRYLRPPEDSKPAIVPAGSQELVEAKPAIVPAGSQELVEAKPAIVPTGSRTGRTSQCAPLAERGRKGVAQKGVEGVGPAEAQIY